jgi:hypothetical protein
MQRTPRWFRRRIRGRLLALYLLVAAAAVVAVVRVIVTAGPTCSPSFGSFRSNVRPPGCWRPYSDQSPFNRPLPVHPKLSTHSSAIVARLIGFGRALNLLAGTAGRGELDGGRPIYFSSPSDPRYTLHCTEHWGHCPLEGVKVSVPAAAQPAGGSDAHLTVIDQHSAWEYDLWGVRSKPPRGGKLVFRWGGKTPVSGAGLGSAAVAARYGTAAGVLRAEELGSGEIRHALFLAVKCDSGHFVYPARHAGAPCASLGLHNGNAPAMGRRFQLAMSPAQIAALPVPAWKKTILRAMARYGMFVGDTGGRWGLGQESGVVYTSFGQPDQWVTLARRWQVPYYSPDHDYVFDLNDGVDWARYLRVVAPCVSHGTC